MGAYVPHNNKENLDFLHQHLAQGCGWTIFGGQWKHGLWSGDGQRIFEPTQKLCHRSHCKLTVFVPRTHFSQIQNKEQEVYAVLNRAHELPEEDRRSLRDFQQRFEGLKQALEWRIQLGNTYQQVKIIRFSAIYELKWFRSKNSPENSKALSTPYHNFWAQIKTSPTSRLPTRWSTFFTWFKRRWARKGIKVCPNWFSMIHKTVKFYDFVNRDFGSSVHFSKNPFRRKIRLQRKIRRNSGLALECRPGHRLGTQHFGRAWWSFLSANTKMDGLATEQRGSQEVYAGRLMCL